MRTVRAVSTFQPIDSQFLLVILEGVSPYLLLEGDDRLKIKRSRNQQRLTTTQRKQPKPPYLHRALPSLEAWITKCFRARDGVLASHATVLGRHRVTSSLEANTSSQLMPLRRNWDRPSHPDESVLVAWSMG